MSDAERMARLEERLQQVAAEHPACREQLDKATDEIKNIRERLIRVEQNHDALEKAVVEMKKDLKEQLQEFKKSVSWAIGTAITVSSVLVSALPYVIGRN
jgi:predicted  nucleic acid-binding Zn-ribbon protein